MYVCVCDFSHLLFFSHSVAFNSLLPHGLQHARLHYLWDFTQTHVHWKLCHPTISSCHPLLLLSSIFPSIALLPRNKCALNLWMQSLTTVTLDPKKISLSLFQLFPHLFAMKWWDLLRNLFAGQEATVITGQGTTDWFQIRKGIHQGCILSPCLVNLYAEYIIRNIGLDEAQASLPGDISITSDMKMTPPLWQKGKKNWRASWWNWEKRVKK